MIYQTVNQIFIQMKKWIDLRSIQAFLLRNEKDIIQIMLATVLILYMLLQNLSG